MDLHKPIDLDFINEDFMADRIINDGKSREAIGKDNTKSPVDTIGVTEIIDRLKEIDLSAPDSIFHDLPDSDVGFLKTDNAEKEFAKELYSAKGTGESDFTFSVNDTENSNDDEFPEIDMNVFKMLEPCQQVSEIKKEAGREEMKTKEEKEAQKKKAELLKEERTNEKEREKEAIKRAKEEAKESIALEKEKIKNQKKLEKTVQNVFSKRKTAVFFLVVFLIIGVLVSSCAALIASAVKSESSTFSMLGFTAFFVDGEKISGTNHVGEFVIVKDEKFQGKHSVLFDSVSDGKCYGDVLALGNGGYIVDMGFKMATVPADSIVGISKISVPKASAAVKAVEGQPVIVVILLAFYFAAVIVLSAIRLKKLGRIIKEYKESYNLV